MRRKSIIIPLILIILFFTAIFIYLFSGKFYARETIFLGQSNFKDSEILSLSEIDLSKNIYLIDIKKARENILKNPYIEDVVIKRKFPETLTFSVKQRIESATVPFLGGYAVIDSNGIVLRILQTQENIKKPLISGVEIDNVKIGEQIHFKDQKKANNFIEIISSASSIDMLINISYIDMEDFENIKMSTNTGIDILVGDMENLSYKLKILNKILIDLQEKAVISGTVDMRYDTDPFYRPNVTMEEVLGEYEEKSDSEDLENTENQEKNIEKDNQKLDVNQENSDTP